MKDENLREILKKCKNLKSLNISGCHMLTDNIFEDISKLSPRLEILELAELSQLNLYNFYKINELSQIKKINISHTNINADHLRRFLVYNPKNLRNLEYWNMDSCPYLDQQAIFLLCLNKLPRLKYINLSHNLNFEEIDIWRLVSCVETLIELEVETILLSDKIKEQLALNRIFSSQRG